jgi:molybdopterin/thiamine biosynthesis adenylyltransferase
MLAKMGVTNFRLVDFDDVDTVNMNSQFFTKDQVGLSKVSALGINIYDFVGIAPELRNTKIEEDIPTHLIEHDIVLLAADNMAVRKWCAENLSYKLAIDGRMAAEEWQIYTFTKDTLKGYLDSWFPDIEAMQVRCTSKATGYCALGISSQIGYIVKQYVSGGDVPRLMFYNFNTLQGLAQ